MNPPYVRHERIRSPSPISPQDYKAAIVRNINALWDGSVEVPGRADLYVPFFFAGAELLKPKGVLCLVTSNAWLDVDYGKAVQHFLLTKTQWIATIDNLKKRTFAQSDINTVITLAVRSQDGDPQWDNPVRFVAFKVPFDDLPPDLLAIAFQEIFEAQKRNQTVEYRVTIKTQEELYREGAQLPDEDEPRKPSLADISASRPSEYTGAKLGKYLRAPDIYF
ncbi:MAG: Eco57I restriction-modification methylase domain-containing protein, partial [Armatimonadota bacterium]|nr:Eco57I restriction-modification methylase domain-containing protein [Armatimonadota bacterium]